MHEEECSFWGLRAHRALTGGRSLAGGRALRPESGLLLCAVAQEPKPKEQLGGVGRAYQFLAHTLQANIQSQAKGSAD